MDTNKMRAEFEAAFVAKYGFGRLTASANADAHAIYEAAKWAWQASREAVVVELPEPESPESYGVTQQDDPEQYKALESRMGAQCSAIFKCKRAIEAQGLKVAP